MERSRPSSLKLTGGEWSGLKIMTPGGKTHPMGERERIALFNMIAEYLPGRQVMDAYAGSGALGIEALSRGAREVMFVEESHVAMRTIVENCRRLGIVEEQAAFYRGPVGAFHEKIILGNGVAALPSAARIIATFPRKVDVILADPPYDDFNLSEIVKLVDYLRFGGIMALSHPGEAPKIPDMELLKTRSYAKANISIYKY